MVAERSPDDEGALSARKLTRKKFFKAGGVAMRKKKAARGPKVSAKIAMLKLKLKQLRTGSDEESVSDDASDDDNNDDSDSEPDAEGGEGDAPSEYNSNDARNEARHRQEDAAAREQIARRQERERAAEKDMALKDSGGEQKVKMQAKLVDPSVPESLQGGWTMFRKSISFWQSTYKNSVEPAVLGQSLLSKLSKEDHNLVIQNIDLGAALNVDMIMKILEEKYKADEYIERRNAVSKWENYQKKDKETLRGYLQLNKELYQQARNAGYVPGAGDGMRLLESADVSLTIRAMILDKTSGDGDGLDAQAKSYDATWSSLWRIALLEEQTSGKTDGKQGEKVAFVHGKGKGKGKKKFKKFDKKTKDVVAALTAKVEQLENAATTWSGNLGGKPGEGNFGAHKGKKGKGKGKGGTGVILPGDWKCPACSANVFGSKDKCFKCNTAKPHNADAAGGTKSEKPKCKFFAKGTCFKGAACTFSHA